MTILQQLLEGTELPKELVEKTETLFEAAVHEKVTALVEEQTAQIKENYRTLLEQELKVQKKTLAEAHEASVAELTALVESTLQTAVLEWADENKVALDSKIKVQLAESFIQSITGVMGEHNVQAPDATTVVLAEQAERIEQLETTLLETINESTALAEKLEGIHREQVLSEATKDLTDTQRERVGTLLEGVECSDLDQYRRKVGVLVEAVVNPTAAGSGSQLNEGAKPSTAQTQVDGDEAGANGKGDGLLVEGAKPNAEPNEPAIDPAVAAYVEAL